MATIRVATTIDAAPAEVWADLRNIESHVEWMHDAVAIRFDGEAREGPGVVFDCDTRIGPFRLTDRMETTEWVDEAVMGVRHDGVVTGVGRFTLTDAGEGRTRFAWEETLRFPWWMGGPIGARVAKPVLRAVWRRNLKNLADRFGD